MAYRIMSEESRAVIFRKKTILIFSIKYVTKCDNSNFVHISDCVMVIKVQEVKVYSTTAEESLL